MRKMSDIIKDMEKDDFALLKVIASNVEQIKEELKEMRDSIKAKVDVADFHIMKQDVEDLKKGKWFVLDIVSNGQSASFYFNRGNIGTLLDVVARQQNSIRTPLVTGGGGGETSHTF